MKKLLCLVLLLPMVTLSGCAATDQVENQSYALILSVSQADDGRYEFGVIIPTFSSGNEGDGEKKEGGSYAIFSSRAADLGTGVHLLNETLPRPLNLTHLICVMISEDVAREERFRSLLQEMVVTYRLYNSADVIITQGSAGEYLEKMKPVVGSRLSISLTSMLEQQSALGVCPRTHIMDIYLAMNSFYSTSKTTYCIASDADELADTTGKLQALFYGAALFDRTHMVGTLSAQETMLCQFLSGNLDTFFSVVNGVEVSIARAGSAQLDIDPSNPEKIGIRQRIEIIDTLKEIAPEDVIEPFTRDMEALLYKCQRLKIEPFGFAGRAAGNYLTFEAWRACDWYNTFSQAEITLSVTMADG